jgi:hypothetical protein
MFIETLEDRSLMSVSPCGISLNLTHTGSTYTLSASQNGSSIGSASLNTSTDVYSYNFTLGGKTFSGSGTF